MQNCRRQASVPVGAVRHMVSADADLRAISATLKPLWSLLSPGNMDEMAITLSRDSRNRALFAYRLVYGDSIV